MSGEESHALGQESEKHWQVNEGYRVGKWTSISVF